MCENALSCDCSNAFILSNVAVLCSCPESLGKVKNFRLMLTFSRRSLIFRHDIERQRLKMAMRQGVALQSNLLLY